LLFLTKDQQMIGWAATREQGMHRFILMHGVLAIGLLLTGISLVWDHAVLRAYQRGLPSLLLYLAINFAGGWLWGWVMWRISERKFRTWNLGRNR